MPEGAVYVGRPSQYGNPFTVAEYGAAGAVGRYIAKFQSSPEFAPNIRRNLRGRDLVCWCAAGSPCHGDRLLKLANS